MQNEVDVIRSLQRGVIAAVAASDNPNLPVKYLLTDNDGINDGQWTVPADQKWLEVVWIPNNPSDGGFLADATQYRGILRLILHWPKMPTGIYMPLGALASIASYFETGRVLSGTQVYGKPAFGGMIEDADDVLFPVSIYYTSYRKGA